MERDSRHNRKTTDLRSLRKEFCMSLMVNDLQLVGRNKAKVHRADATKDETVFRRSI